MSTDQLPAVLGAYIHALTRVFVISAALSACMIFGALPVEWKSIKGKHEGADDEEKSTKPDSDGARGEAKVRYTQVLAGRKELSYNNRKYSIEGIVIDRALEAHSQAAWPLMHC